MARRMQFTIPLVAAMAALVAGLQWLNDSRVRDTVCGANRSICTADSPLLALEVNWTGPALPTGGTAPVLRLHGSTALLRKTCDGNWTAGFGARVDLEPLALGNNLAVAGGCADLGWQRSSAALLGVRVRQGDCVLELEPVTLAWQKTLDLHAEARVAPEAAQACTAALGDRVTSARLGPLAGWRLTLDAHYVVPHGNVPELSGAAASPAPSSLLRQAVSSVAMSHEVVLSAEAGRLTLGLASQPATGPAPASAEMTLRVAAEGVLRERLPPELQTLLASSNDLRLRWTLDHETGVVFVQDQPEKRLASAARPPGPVALADECTAERTVPLHFVEAGERGEAIDASQLQAVFAAVDEAQARAGALVSVFVHGWQHSGAKGDSYVCGFAALLSAVDTMERTAARQSGRQPREVVGVYLGWPGRLYAGELANLTTFWNRLDAADRLGTDAGVLRALIQGLAQRITLPRRDPRPDRRSGLVVTGHSMGARAVFQSLRQASDAPALQAAPGLPAPDLVLMVNPAFSADQFRAVHSRAMHCQPLPVPMLLFSSEADVVTRQVYPAGQAVTFDAARQRRVPFLEHAYTAANFDEFVTHRLTFELLSGAMPAVDGEQSILRGFERVPAGSDELLKDNPVTVFRQPSQGRPAPADAWYRMRVVADNAALPTCAVDRSRVMKVDQHILPDHGTIFTPPFMEFVIRTFNHGGPAAR